MKGSKFNAAKLSRFKGVAKGSKLTNDARPEVYLSRGINKFVINGTAAARMGLEHGDCVTILADAEATSVNEKYLLVQTDLEHGNKVAAHKSEAGMGKPLTFNNSILWGQMIQMTADAEPMSEATLCQAGYMAEYDTIKGRDGQMCKAVLATSRVTFVPVEIEDAPAEIAGIPVVKVWELTDAKRFLVKEDGKSISKFAVGEEAPVEEPAEAPEELEAPEPADFE